MKKAKSEQVIRRVVLGREYKIYAMTFTNGIPTTKELEILTAETRPSEVELFEKHKLEKGDKVIIIPTKVITGNYGVPIDKFMEMATLVDKKEKLLSEGEKGSGELEETEEQV